MREIIIVGAGASGMTAAIAAARAGARDVTILEHMDLPGKKILATGNGKCNFTNKEQGIQFYRGTYPAFVWNALSQFGLNETLEFFQTIGVPSREKGGYYYPYCEEAAAVREALVTECERLGIKILCDIGIREIRQENDGFLFDTKSGIFKSRICILATGGKAAKQTGSDGSGFLYLDNFRQPTKDVVPALVQLKAKQPFFKKIAGIRAISAVELYIEESLVTEETGELQITDYGISGIPVFQLSRYASYGLREGKTVWVTINFLPEYGEKEAGELLKRQFSLPERSLSQALYGVLHKKLIPVILDMAHVTDKKSSELSEQEFSKLFDTIRKFHVDIIGTNGFDKAQVTAGGVDTAYVDEATMESKITKGLYFCGEILDIDGKCGGYNLQWAWSSGTVAGRSAALSQRGNK